MSNIDLYKKYKPKVWEDIIGQDKIVESLRNSVKNDNNTSTTSYIFSGPAGVGKTASAFIYAKALNCENPQEGGNPCNECDTCKAIDNGSLIGVEYLSMANNGSVDDIRRIVEQTNISQPIKQKVLILDETHYLSKAAFGALLIPLESENTRTKFIFCTTEPNKIDSAVMSRSQHRAFSPVKDSILARHLAKISMNEGWLILDGKNISQDSKVTKDDITNIVLNSHGSVRTAIGNLQSFIDTGAISKDSTIEMISALLSLNPIEVYKKSDELYLNGESYVGVLESMYKIIQNALIKKVSNEQLNTIQQEINNKMNPSSILSCLDIIGDGLSDMSNRVVDYKILFERVMLKIILDIKRRRNV